MSTGFGRKIDLSKFGGGANGQSDDEDDDLPLAAKQPVLTAERQQTWTSGTQRKSKKDLEREKERVKREEEERDAARVFAEFSAEFEGESAGGGSGSSSSSKAKKGGGFVRASGDGGSAPRAYEPSRPIGGSGGASAFKARAPSPPPLSNAPKPKGKRAMDSFLEEMKKDQAAREERFRKSGGTASSVSVHAAWERERGSHDTGDEATTNVYVGNLPPNVMEQPLGLLFAKIGPVGSVKIMWPRLDEPPPGVDPASFAARRVGSKAGLTGFVSYMKRKDAEVAIREMDNLDWGGSVLRVGWSKAVPVPKKALYDITSGSSRRSRSRSPPPSSSSKRRRSPSPPPSRSNPNTSSSSSSYRHPSSRDRSRSRSPPRGPRADLKRQPPRDRSRSRSRSPPRPRLPKLDDVEKEHFIKIVAGKVKELGREFEVKLREKERGNEKFGFLRDEKTPEYHFFQACLDPYYRPPTPPPPPFVDTGYNSIYSTDSEEDSERERTKKKGVLGKLARRRFASCLRGLKGERGEVARCMMFALERAEFAEEIAEMIVQSLLIFDTPIPLKIARLYLVSDILSNSASPIPNAWKYRSAFETRLPAAFTHFGDLYASFKAQAGRLSAESFKGQITTVLDILELWIVFNPSYTVDLRARLLGTAATITNSSITTSDTSSSNTAAAATAHQPKKVDEAEFKSKFKKSNFSSSGFSSVPVAAAATMDEDVDGEAMDEDLDGEAM